MKTCVSALIIASMVFITENHAAHPVLGECLIDEEFGECLSEPTPPAPAFIPLCVDLKKQASVNINDICEATRYDTYHYKTDRNITNRFTFTLIHKEEGMEFWKDNATGLIWSDIFKDQMNQFAGRDACSKFNSNTAISNSVGDVTWGLPNAREINEATRHRFDHILPSRLIWLDDYLPFIGAGARFENFVSWTDLPHINKFWIRCVGR